MLVGYARVSTSEQLAGFEAQHRQLVATGCNERIFSEQTSSVGPRPQLEAALDFVREGDTLVVTRLDRLARSTTDLLSVVQRLEQKCVALRILDFGGSAVDTQSPSGKLMLTMFAALAQFERELMLTRQKEGIAKAKTEGRYKGRAPTARAKLPQIRALHEQGVPASEIATRLSISRASAYRLVASFSEAQAASQ
jgi:DNA invertase Pin-like site-specific DNA recombinase